jgi:hypothetical protein
MVHNGPLMRIPSSISRRTRGENGESVHDALSLPLGKRLIVVGSSGSGKTTFARRVLTASPYHWVIFNPKGTPAYKRLSPHNNLTRINERELKRSITEKKYTILDLPTSWNYKAQDDLVKWLTDEFVNIGILFDELYTIHHRGIAGPGLDGLVTRGREINQTFLGLSQRPKFISKFLFSEANAIVEFKLLLLDDRKVIYENTGERIALSKRENHDFIYFDLDADRATIYRG